MRVPVQSSKTALALMALLLAGLAGPLCSLVGLCGMPCCDHPHGGTTTSIDSPVTCAASRCDIGVVPEELRDHHAVVSSPAAPAALPAVAALDRPDEPPAPRLTRPEPRPLPSEHVSIFILNSSYLI